ncbi:hypothetical protein [Falsiroseomonas oryzae]|nr:hypothetical protein [Roseomonas sp. MO-31]
MILFLALVPGCAGPQWPRGPTLEETRRRQIEGWEEQREWRRWGRPSPW